MVRKQERIKTLILWLLILNSLFLTAQVWFRQELWADYALFDALRETVFGRFFSAPKTVTVSSFDGLTRPARIITCRGESRRGVLTPDNPLYTEADNSIKAIMDMLYEVNNPQYIMVSEQDWKTAIQGRSVMLDYGIKINSRLITKNIGGTENKLSAIVSELSEITLCPEQRNAAVFIRNTQNGGIYKFVINGVGDSVNDIINVVDYEREYLFAFEAGISNADSLVLLTMDEVNEVTAIQVDNPAGNLSISDMEKIIIAFGSDPSRFRRSMSDDGTVSYIGSNRTIIFHSNGLLEFFSVDAESGIKGGNLTDMVNVALKTASDQAQVLIGGNSFDVRVTSDLIGTDSDEYTIKMNYFYNGLPLYINIPGNAAARTVNDAVTAEFSGGNLVRFRMLPRVIMRTTGTVDAGDAMSAIDGIYLNDSEIRRITQCYAEDGTTGWQIIFENGTKELM